MSFLHIRVVEAIGLAPTDLNGFADPYCKLQLFGVSNLSDNAIQKSQVKKKSTDPLWDECFSFKVSEKDLENGSLNIFLYDSDKGKDDAMGFAVLHLSTFKSDATFEGWLPVRGSNKMRNKQQFRQEIIKQQHESANITETKSKGDMIARTPTDFDYITSKSEEKVDTAQEPNNDELTQMNTVNNSKKPQPNSNHSSNHNSPKMASNNLNNFNNNNNNNNGNNNNGNNNNSLNNNNNNYNNSKNSSNASNNSNSSIKSNNSNNSNNNDDISSIGSSLSLKKGKSQPSTNLFRKNQDGNGNNIASPNQQQGMPMSLSGRKLAQYKSAYDVTGAIEVGDEEKANEYDYSYGVRDTDSGRIFIIARFEKMQHFGSVDQKILIERGKENLKIFPKSTQKFPIEIYAATFNCGNSRIDDLYKWIPRDNSVDMYVLALQEMKQRKERKGGMHGMDYASDNEDELPDKLPDKLNKTGMQNNGSSASELDESPYKPGLMDESNSNMDGISSFYLDEHGAALSQQEELEHLLKEHLGGDYITVGNHKMWMIRLFIFAKKKYDERISNVTAHHRAAGVGGVGRNKGAVVISLDFDGVSLCFVCAHLTAHQHKTEERNKMYKTICKNIKVGWPKQQMLAQFHHIFWMGDLNYRIDFGGNDAHDKTPKKEVFDQFIGLIKDKKYDKLLQECQLKSSMHKRNAFVGFHEGKINFPPTFKVERKKGLEYQRQRLPAWCDRILFKSEDGFELKYKIYECNSEVFASDHKPVYCRFVLDSWYRAPSISDACKSCSICFSEISASNLIAADINGTSDPFIHFPRQLLLSKFVQTKRCNRTLDPKWKDKKMKDLPLIRNSLPFLSKCLLLLQVRDHDTFSSNDIIAYGCIPLANSVKNLNKFVDFRIILTLDGKDAGTLQGKMKLIYELNPQYDPKFKPKV